MNGLGVVIETARRAQGWTQEQLATRADVTQEAVSRYERDLRDPDDETLRRLADALNVTPSFLRDAGKVRGAVGLDAHMRRRKTAKPGDWKRLEARLNMHRLHARRVFDEVVVRTEQRVPAFDLDEVDPATAARFVRSQWRMPIGPVRELVRWVEAAGCLVIEEDFGTRGVDGLSQWIDEIPIVMLNAQAPADRRRWTLAHELGHLCLHSHEPGDAAEDEANAFAAELLMPREVIRAQLRNLTLGRLLDLKREWAVSMQALIERAWGESLITAQQRTNLYKALSAKGWRSLEPLGDAVARERPALAYDIGDALTARGLSPEELAHVVGFADPGTQHPFVRPARLRLL
ncbi:MAG TPA: XRE family transcriptional regulator [Mycobacteriales bacterium]|jgi:Zn-dependent peptidase ImmA (M78 family)/transcriptional regulator with XRE-family HTH domain|nr:XRE family transcriptional regulator [Mycobacteriales bacterium]